MTTKIFTAYDPPPSVGIDFAGEKSLTRQSEAKDCDINVIMARFEKTGMLPQTARDALYLDVSAMPDYRQTMDQINTARDYFMSLPAMLRSKFNNDPATFLDFMSDDNNRQQAIELGLLPEPESIEAPPAPLAPPTGSETTPEG